MPHRSGEPADVTAEFEQLVSESDGTHYVLRLYVTGMTPRSSRAIANAKAICERHLKGRYDLLVIDVYQQPVAVQDDQIVALPTLIKQLPLPLRRIVGDLADMDRALLALDLKRKE